MKIGITCYPTYGGSGAIATELGIELSKRGHEIHFISYAQPFRLPHFMPRVYFHEVETTRYPLFEHNNYSLSLAAMMHEVALRAELDLLHVHYAIPHATSAWIAREMLGSGHPLKIVTTLHGTDITLVGQERSYFDITRFSIQKSDGITAVSDYLKRETVDRFRVPGDTIEVIHNFVDPRLYRRGSFPCRKETFLRPDEMLVMHVSNFRTVKRIADVVRIFARIHKQIPSKLMFVGDGPERPTATAEAEALGITDRVIFLGKQDSVAELMTCADLLLLPSASESFGLVALEAMASGVPVVSSNAGGLPEVVEDGVTGHMGSVGDVEAMAEMGVSILRDNRKWLAMSVASQKVAAERFGVDVIVPQYERYYERVLADAPAPPAESLLATAGDD
ncbi:N-acetyl-alpha-D-glucosaminyl L-malate synthase BshA [Longimicrobium sp.]|uniref:N-acetyl-alpha-D-glucosaminyl L-malate synthase BshA n=1 Tax=Longimicrobium sp. TaxID=2029185 RepID=UPI003B3BE23B